MTGELDKYILDVDYDCETGEEHCTVLKTDRTTNMTNWIGIVSAMYTHHSVFESLIKELNNLSDGNEQLKSFKDRVFNLFAKEIKEENELLDYYIKEKAPYNADRQQIIIGVLKRLQKELEE